MRSSIRNILAANSLLIAGFLALSYTIRGNAGILDGVSIVSGIYATSFNVLYNKNMRFYMFISRLKFRISPTSTLWMASFRFNLEAGSIGERTGLIQRIIDQVRLGGHGDVSVGELRPESVDVVVDDLIGLRISVDDDCVFVCLDRKLPVSSDQYAAYQRKLRRLADHISLVVEPTDLRCELQVSFRPGAPNPYYGFFVNRVPRDLLQDFKVRFRLNQDSNCRIVADLDHVGVNATNLGDLFEALTEIVGLRALPGGIS